MARLWPNGCARPCEQAAQTHRPRAACLKAGRCDHYQAYTTNLGRRSPGRMSIPIVRSKAGVSWLPKPLNVAGFQEARCAS